MRRRKTRIKLRSVVDWVMTCSLCCGLMNCNVVCSLPLTTSIDLPQKPAPLSGAPRPLAGTLQRAHSFAVGVGLTVAAASTMRLSFTGCATDRVAIERTAAISIVFGTLTDPRADGISVADRQLLLAVRHTHLRGGTPIEEPHQVAALRVAGDDHGAELGALHQPFIGREVEPAFFVTRAAALVAARTSAFEDRQYVLGEALRFRRA